MLSQLSQSKKYKIEYFKKKMLKLYKGVLYLIFQEFHIDKKTLYSCLLVDKTWCETIIPILWKDPWKLKDDRKRELLLNVILLRLSDESRNNLRQYFSFLTNSDRKPLFDYISFCRHLNLTEINEIINTTHEKSKIPFIQNEIFKLLINENTKYTKLYIPRQF